MKPRRFSILLKTTIATLLLLMLVTPVAYVIFRRNWTHRLLRDEQQISWGVAGDLARRMQPFLDPEVDYLRARDVAYETIALHPRFDVYLISENGQLIEDFSEIEEGTRPTIGLDGIRTFLRSSPESAAPILGENPRYPGPHRSIFSVAPVRVEGKPAYVYVVILNRSFELVSETDDILSAFASAGPSLAAWLAGAMGVGWMGFYILTRPLRDVASTLQAYQGPGAIRPLEIASHDEIGDIARAFNRMAGQINSHVSELEKKDELRRELIADVSHDLRGPVTAVNGYVELLAERDQTLEPAKKAEFYRQIRNGMTALNDLLSDLFQLSRLEANDEQLHFEPVSADHLLEELALSYRLQCEERGISLLASCPEGLQPILADRRLLTRALRNLIDNALRYTAPGGTIELRAVPEENGARLEVADSGSGIAQADLPKIFDRSYQSASQEHDTKGSAGLGLAIVKKIVESHDGTISVRSEPGAGTVFAIQLRTNQAG